MAFNKKKVEEKVLDVDAAMQGTLSFKDPVNLKINGRFEGNLETKGSLTIGSTAIVIADIKGDIIVIAGKVKGKVTAREKLILLSSAILEGEISPTRLTVADGAILEGKCSMLADFLNVEELARYLEVESISINEWADAGKIPAIKDGNSWKFERKSVDSWIASGKVGK
ncbi:MAG: polymer-forming cytoskeletal protein [Candidatus Omnitrophota bacterium]|nr:polymer-forming cytoskeletal protein [Candidatus Omnitrophota bacterium]MBU1928397.1 polymer-forming cytoskeletal protein [Candidatus Omnitrophota bacterium]MBU2035708.1 polymer-forming cytoskeletal protein [Candidatus Omnitrophota bacterium]MBU2221744.1 polymer-forming cytoskeletal protein [Candidatus Omnitrophota bacterium]MBU2258657.1 polymer-forming cytoskeletal protein [Candidatus Omnitrophota bacterium]